jgi:hypothetical protein
MNKLILSLLIVVSSVAQARVCNDNEGIHNMLPDKTTLSFKQVITTDGEMGLQFSAGKLLSLHETKSLGRSILILSTDTAIRGSYVFRKIDVKKTDTSADDTPFIFEPLNGQSLEISLYQRRSQYDFRDERYISVGSLKYNLGTVVTLKAECKD